MIAEKEKKDIRSFTQEELEQYFTENNEKAFRAKQIYQWLWQKGARSFAEMTNLSKELRSFLRDNYKFNCILPELSQKSEDNTIKTRFSLHDRHKIEGVLIPSKDRVTACISSQAGCSLSCHFCATGFLDLKRNLDAAEIYDQVFLLREMAKTSYDRSLSNIVYMCMGEPLLNYKNVLRSIDLITYPKGL
ncbi:MAG: 23S rRNA (adenine(2503)-C(2))-methyltransferase RlmN, partial [Bacteroidetes bacterium]|nr:23S rRNA (adenine(2503)-C(2))-methyltransferase RlmN [Bacteroidota bacterium]